MRSKQKGVFTPVRRLSQKLLQGWRAPGVENIPAYELRNVQVDSKSTQALKTGACACTRILLQMGLSSASNRSCSNNLQGWKIVVGREGCENRGSNNLQATWLLMGRKLLGASEFEQGPGGGSNSLQWNGCGAGALCSFRRVSVISKLVGWKIFDPAGWPTLKKFLGSRPNRPE